MVFVWTDKNFVHTVNMKLIKKIGTFSNRKQMVLMTKPFPVFISEFYLPMLEKYAYHRPHFILLGKN